MHRHNSTRKLRACQSGPFFCKKGQALLETAIILPIIILFVVMIIETALLANAKSLLRYSAFCVARAASVGCGSKVELKEAAVLPLLSITRSNEVGSEKLLPEADYRTHFVNRVKLHLSPGTGGLTQLQVLPHNRKLGENLRSTWRRTHVSIARQDGIVTASVGYFYVPFFPLPAMTRMINRVWEMTPKESYRDRILMMLKGRDADYQEWRRSNLIPLFENVECPIETNS